MVWPNRRARKGCWSVDVKRFRAWCDRFWLSRGIWEDGAWVNVDTQRVEVSAAAYLSKYMSKGGELLEEFVAENGWSAVPGQWWNCTKPMRDAVKRELIKGEAVGKLIETHIDYLFATSDFRGFWSCRTVDREVDGRFVTVGYCGILKAEVVREAQEMIRMVAPGLTPAAVAS
jgi:hypothetical protein